MNRPFIVAELSANHGGSFDTAAALVKACAAAGADAIKLQTWTPGTMVLDKSLVIESGPWAGRNMSELYERAHTPWEWHKPLFDIAKSLNIVGFSSVFDLQALDFLESIDCPMYKISSFDCTDIRLIERVAATKKPLVISTGMATWVEAADAAHAALNAGCTDLTMLRCVSAYPAAPEACFLRSMDDIRALAKAGFSDHTTGIGAAVAAAVLGASLIEKHVMLDHDQTLDSGFSIRPGQLANMVTAIREAVAAADYCKQTEWGSSSAESPQRGLRKSIYVIKDMHKGQRFSPDCLGTARPALGIPCIFWEKLINRRAKTSIIAGTPMSWNLLM